MPMNWRRALCQEGRLCTGSVLILVLIVLSSLVALTVGLAYRTRIEIKLVQAMADRTKAFHLACGGIERIKTLLGQGELSPETIATICPFVKTANQEELFQQLDSFQVGRMRLAYKLHDEQGFLHLNKSNPAAWENIPGLSRECASSILDWIDSDDTPSLDGAESDYYRQVDSPYLAKNRPCTALRELLFVRGVDRSGYLAAWDGMRGGGGDGQAEESDRAADEVADPGLLSIFTVYGNGAININTVGREILASLPGLDEQVGEAILAHRYGPDGLPGTKDDRPFKSAEDIAQVAGLSGLHMDLLEQYCCVESTFFRVFSRADSGGKPACCLMASIQVTDGQVKVLCVERLF